MQAPPSDDFVELRSKTISTEIYEVKYLQLWTLLGHHL